MEVLRRPATPLLLLLLLSPSAVCLADDGLQRVANVDPTTARPGREPTGRFGNAAAVRVSAAGLKADSPRMFWVYKQNRCVKRGRAGRVETVPPGRYQIRVGFPSGSVSREVDLKQGEQFSVPTGLFTFKRVTPETVVSTVPQKLYHLESGAYLTTGYQGETARLYPGRYRVCYQDIDDEQPSVAFGPWHVIGVWPNPRPDLGFDKAYPPEQHTRPGLTQKYPAMGKTVRWMRIEDYPEIDVVDAIPFWGVAYATATLDSDVDRDVELVMNFRSGVKVWLNGKLVKSLKPLRRAYASRRLATFVSLVRGPNVLFVKTLRGAADWPLGAVAIRWKMYDVAVAAESEEAAR